MIRQGTWRARRWAGELAPFVLLPMLLGARAGARQEPVWRVPVGELQPGHWIEARGARDESGRFRIEEARLLEPQKYAALIGTLEAEGQRPGQLSLLGLALSLAEDTQLDQLPPELTPGTRVKVEGRYLGAGLLAAREIGPRGAGRDRVLGRIDAVRAAPEGFELEVLSLVLLADRALELESERPLAEVRRAPLPAAGAEAERDEDDALASRFELARGLRFGGLLEYEAGAQQDYDLDAQDEQDRREHALAARARLSFEPQGGLFGQDFLAVAELRERLRWREDEEDGSETVDRATLGETYALWSDLGQSGLSLQLGRQDFDDPREWIYDQNLDALRAAWTRAGLRLELSASTSLPIAASTSERDEHTTNLIAYLSNDDLRRHLAAWIVDRRDDSEAEDSPIWFGARALGRWIEDNKSWAELALRRGFREFTDLEGFALDLGSTWSPPFAEPFYFTAGYARGSGDDQPFDGVDQAFRQTGFHDNTAKFGGVTSFQYYGELFDPELSNLEVWTLGLGFRPFAKTSLDLVWHAYRQDELALGGLYSELDAHPNGSSADLGTELDLVFGWRAHESFDLEIAAARFDPGSAFDGMDPAWLLRFQIRYRF